MLSAGNDNEPNACVSMNIHPDRQCAEEPKVVTFPTFTEKGKSGCYEDDSITVDIKDQYCNLDTGNFHQLIYPKGSHCDDSNIKWYLKWIFPMNQTFTTDGCLSAGPNSSFSLGSCTAGPCPSNSAEEEDDEEDSREIVALLANTAPNNGQPAMMSLRRRRGI